MRPRLCALLFVGLMACGARSTEAAGIEAKRAQLAEKRVIVAMSEIANLQAEGGTGKRGVSHSAVASAVSRAFEEGQVFRLADPDGGFGTGEPMGHMTVTYREVSPPGGRDLLLHISVDGLPEPLPALDATVLLERELSQGAPLEDDVATAASRAARVIDAKADLDLSGRSAAERLVGSEDPELVLLALEWIREQAQRGAGLKLRLGGLADEVASSLSHEDERVRLTAIETLGAVGGPAHVDALLDNLHLADPGHAYRTYEALAQLGGPKAMEFLGFAARNEEEPERRQAAQRAFEQAASSPAAPPNPSPVSRGHRR